MTELHLMGGLGLELRHLFAASYDIASQAGQNSPQANRNCPSAPNKQSVTAWIMMSHHMINRREKKAKKKSQLCKDLAIFQTRTHRPLLMSELPHFCAG